ncbi:DEHA2F14894p [Debaryomyces hansenii CBS767]|uniref:DEHA2F14894p n=1 Tax=Debaryomyces hansenii (strain ATCC 36239 / CBS 767 / BCRC 21394 / JCM 1990 / NBRC 0083 / IGC 2968) TaxID=284592 RepID=B5RUH1_DEBHA|nr:DEHA2F14894p [Debaryomyces hansenii CBS767]CAR66349.1 DEHA2F14894p [Debaryomyces hansenii CBS767]|eukprot:XP_002770826.1 DEHA2F14894p [Debaryomyces hansenii CBS767]
MDYRLFLPPTRATDCKEMIFLPKQIDVHKEMVCRWFLHVSMKTGGDHNKAPKTRDGYLWI